MSTDRTGPTWISRGPAVVLERMTLDEWDDFLAGELTADDLRKKYVDSADDEQAELSRWDR